jgi:hypothetical protein
MAKINRLDAQNMVAAGPFSFINENGLRCTYFPGMQFIHPASLVHPGPGPFSSFKVTIYA